MKKTNFHFAQNKNLSFAKLLPNMVTLTAICFGLTSIRYALDHKWQISVSLIIIAGILDVIDGRLARLLKTTTRFGAQLDSLADFVDFGVAPAIVIYLWKLQKFEIKGLGWALVLFYIICCVVRLARFNVEEEQKNGNHSYTNSKYFSGVPSPMSAYVIIIPLMLEINPLYSIETNKWLEAALMIATSLLMVSRIPTFSTKNISIQPANINLFFACFAIALALISIQPWVMLPIIGFLYILSIPYTYYKHYKNQ